MSLVANDIAAVNFLQADSPAVIIPRRSRVASISITTSGSAGSVELKNGASGTVQLKIVTDANSSMHDVVIPGDGILFGSEVYCTLTNVTSVTVFYS
jgi:hypothetical protein|tara:strand:- start:9312 stop:9602 length:291 start_codon:yes stop_codon:yes gene_type:complete